MTLTLTAADLLQLHPDGLVLLPAPEGCRVLKIYERLRWLEEIRRQRWPRDAQILVVAPATDLAPEGQIG